MSIHGEFPAVAMPAVPGFQGSPSNNVKCLLALADCEAFLIGSARLALRASPQAITSVLRLHFSEIHRCPIMLASDARRSFFFDFSSALHEEIPSRSVVADQATGLAASVSRCLTRIVGVL